MAPCLLFVRSLVGDKIAALHAPRPHLFSQAVYVQEAVHLSLSFIPLIPNDHNRSLKAFYIIEKETFFLLKKVSFI